MDVNLYYGSVQPPPMTGNLNDLIEWARPHAHLMGILRVDLSNTRRQGISDIWVNNTAERLWAVVQEFQKAERQQIKEAKQHEFYI